MWLPVSRLAALALGLTPARPVPVLVELFTSEGCSSCPPADEGLARLVQRQPVRDVEVVPLALHVDYWNGLGWRDPYSAAQFSDLQQEFCQAAGLQGPYTPQLVVDGRDGFVWDESTAIRAIAAAATQPKGELQLALQAVAAGAVRVAVVAKSLPGGAEGHPRLFVAVTESHLASRVTRGENAGRTLHHRAVVRYLRPLGAVELNRSVDVTVPLEAGWKRGDLELVAFVQDSTGRVVAVTTAGL